MTDEDRFLARLAVLLGVLLGGLLGLVFGVAIADAAPADIAKFGFPEGTPIEQGQFVFAFDGRTREPRWTLERLDWDTIHVGRAIRNESFTSDARIPKPFRVTDADYTAAAGFDRGHLAPADDFGRVADHAATFLFSNCVPQNAALNRGLWAQLERQIRDSVGTRDRAWILTFPVFESRIGRVSYAVCGPHAIAVPTHLAKAVLILHGNRSQPDELPAWIVPNKIPREGAKPDDYRAPLENIEAESGLEIWSSFDRELKHELGSK